MDERIEGFLKDALETEPSAAANDRILAAIRGERVAPERSFVFRWRMAACLAVMLCAGIVFHQYREFQQQEQEQLCEEGEVMLEIIGMASIEDFYDTGEDFYAVSES